MTEAIAFAVGFLAAVLIVTFVRSVQESCGFLDGIELPDSFGKQR